MRQHTYNLSYKGLNMFTSKLTVALGLACLLVECEYAAASLIVNGDFEAGNSGFTSDYVYVAPPGTNSTEGQYTVRSDPQNFNGAFFAMPDHTTGTGLMMIINGATRGSPSVWRETLAVQANTDYDFLMWVSTAVDGGPAVLEISINGASLGVTTAPAVHGSWQQFTASWNAGLSPTADIRIVNSNLSVFPNDFYLDDISFTEANVSAAVPEPCSLVLWSLSCLGISCVASRRRRCTHAKSRTLARQSVS